MFTKTLSYSETQSMTDEFDAINVDLENPGGSCEKDTNVVAQVESSLTNSDSDSESNEKSDTTQNNNNHTIVTPVLLERGETNTLCPPEHLPQVESSNEEEQNALPK